MRYVRLDGLRIDTPICSTEYFVLELRSVYLKTLFDLESGTYGTETFPSAAALAHLLERNDLCTFARSLQTADQPADAGADNENLAVFFRRKLRLGNLAILECNGTPWTWACCLEHR